jgi:predicted RNase H-like nuclease (RuvC/YqgF family)
MSVLEYISSDNEVNQYLSDVEKEKRCKIKTDQLQLIPEGNPSEIEMNEFSKQKESTIVIKESEIDISKLIDLVKEMNNTMQDGKKENKKLNNTIQELTNKIQELTNEIQDLNINLSHPILIRELIVRIR